MSDLYDSIVHGLRSKGWSKGDAEAEALERIEFMRAKAKIAPINKDAGK